MGQRGRLTGAVVALAVAVLAMALITRFALAPVARFKRPRTVVVRPGEPLKAVAARLARRGVVRSGLALVLYGDLTGGARKIKPGEYAFSGGESAAQVLQHLVNGDFLTIAVTIPEGMTMRQIADRLQASRLVCARDFIQAATRGPIPTALGLRPLGLEGYLFPAAYRFAPNVSADQITATMAARFYRILTPAVEQRLSELGMTDRGLVTLASIIEREAKVPGERPIIASVFYNRMKLGMPLQSDSTAQYNRSWEAKSAVLAVRRPSAFNTYDFRGLPPGPIANPGLASIMAALYPAQTNYLYFVATRDGSDLFSRTYAGHLRNIARIRQSSLASPPASNSSEH